MQNDCCSTSCIGVFYALRIIACWVFLEKFQFQEIQIEMGVDRYGKYGVINAIVQAEADFHAGKKENV